MIECPMCHNPTMPDTRCSICGYEPDGRFRSRVLCKYTGCIELYHGGDADNLAALKKKFEILSPESKLKLPSTGGGKIGLSTTTDKKIARQYSSVFGNKDVLTLYLKNNAKIYDVDSKGKGIDDFMANEDILALQSKGYDAVRDTGSKEKEYRILSAKNIIIR